jgi:TolB protein
VRFVVIFALGFAPALLTAAPVPKADPPPRVLVVASSKTGDNEIYVVNADTGEAKNITNRKSSDTAPVWSPDGRRIAYISDHEGGRDDVWTMAADGSDQKRLTKMPERSSYPAWSPDGSRIAFTSWTVVQRGLLIDDIYTVEVATGTVKQLTKGPVRNYTPAWSPDGKRLSYYSIPDGMLTINADGTDARQFGMKDSSYAVWSSDGTRIAYTNHQLMPKPPEGYKLFVAGADGKDAKLVVQSDAWLLRPRWSPDGKQILFARRVDSDTHQLAVVGADGGDVNVIAETQGYLSHRWLPDGKSVSYVRAPKDKPPELVIDDAAGGKPKVILTHVLWSSPGEWKPK